MTYDFTTYPDRKGKDALAIDLLGRVPGFPFPKEGFDPIPMWVADMSFPVLPDIQKAMTERIREPHFGYFSPRDEYLDAILDWQRSRFGESGLTKKDIGYENGVLGGLISALSAVCARGDSVLIHSPTYVGFTGSMENAGWHLVHSPLVRDRDGIWRMDLEDMEKKIVSHKIHAAVFCSPHNPCGRVWEREELEAFMDLCRRRDVHVISDEIWSDIILPGYTHLPTRSVSSDAAKRTISLYAPSKTFNLAGLVGSYHIITDPALRDRVRKEGSLSHYNNMNVLSMYALMGAYSPAGRLWREELCRVIDDNVSFACSFIKDRFPLIDTARPQGTYMLFLDCTSWCRAHEKSLDDLLALGHAVGVYWQDGRPFHGPCHIRMNLALPEHRLREALDRLDRYVFNPACS